MARPGPTDAKLVERSLAGDRAAFGLLVDRHRAGVARVLQAMFANLGGVEDLVQESFLRAYLDLERLRDPGRFGAWVRGIAVNMARMELRSGRLFVPWESIRPGSGRSQPSLELLAERREVVRRIRQAIAALPPAEREAITHVYLGELSHKEAAEELDTSVGAIKVRVHRGRKRLRKRLVVEFAPREGQMEVKMIEVTVQDVLAKQAIEETVAQVDLSTPPDEWLKRLNLHRVVLLAEQDGERLLPIWVGPAEGEALSIHIRGQSPISRPLTFDLMKELFAVGDMELQGVALSRLHEHVYYGMLIVETNDDGRQEIDCRPSDAINLAARMQAPIYVAPEVMEQFGKVADDSGDYSFLQVEPGEQWVSIIQS